jgi:hypothetical protein
MHIGGRACSPDALRRLQTIFDVAWLQLEQKRGRHTFPWATEASRYSLAQLVLAHSWDHRHIEEIVQEVLDTLEGTPAEPLARHRHEWRNPSNIRLYGTEQSA